MLAVYTCSFGENLSLKPVVAEENIDYICFSDRPIPNSCGWRVVTVSPVFPDDLPRSSRNPKIRPHRWLAGYERSIYIDSSVTLTASPDNLWSFLMGESDSVLMGVFEHSFRETLLEEFEAVREANFDASFILASQLESYRFLYPELLSTRPFWGGIIARRHMETTCVDAMELWWAHVLRYSRRDQLSLPVVLDTFPHDTAKITRGVPLHEGPQHNWHGSPKSIEYLFTDFPLGDSALEEKLFLSFPIPVSGFVSNPLPAIRWNLRVLAHQLVGEATTVEDETEAVLKDPPSDKKGGSKVRVRKNFRGEPYVSESFFGKKTYLSDLKRAELYRNGVEARLQWLLRDYRIPTDLLGTDSLVVDVGANSGELGLISQHRGAHYIGIEPDPVAFAALCKNNPKGRSFSVALGESNGVKQFYMSTAEADSSLIPPKNFDEVFDVEVRTLDSLLDEVEPTRSVTLLKIEAEGAEPEVLLGAEKTLRRTTFVAVDAGPERRGQSVAPWVVDFLSTRGFLLVDTFSLRGTFLFRSD